MSKGENKVVSSLFWSFAERIGSQGVNLIISVVLARLILPEEYGIIAAAQVFISLATSFVSGGFGNALVQKKDCDDKDYSSMFVFNTVFSLSVYALIFISAPSLVSLFNETFNHDILVKVIRILGIGIVFSSFYSYYYAILTKHLLFKKIFKLTLTGTIISACVGIYAAYRGFGVWALVIQSLMSNLINTLLFVATSKWRPHFYFSFKRFKPLFLYGVRLMLSGLMISIYSELTSLLIGTYYSSEDLAYYKKGISFTKLLVLNIITAINTSLFPILANIDSFDEQKRIVRKFNRISAFVITPMMFGLAAVADSFVEIVLTKKWLPSVLFLQISCINYSIQPLGMSSLQFLKASGRATEYLVLDIIRKVVSLILLVIAVILKKGVWFIAVSEVVGNFVAIFINMYPGKKHIGYTIREQLEDVLPKFLLSAIMFVLVYLIGLLPIIDIVKLFVQIIIGIFVYIIGAKLCRMKEFDELLDMGIRSLKK